MTFISETFCEELWKNDKYVVEMDQRIKLKER